MLRRIKFCEKRLNEISYILDQLNNIIPNTQRAEWSKAKLLKSLIQERREIKRKIKQINNKKGEQKWQ